MKPIGHSGKKCIFRSSQGKGNVIAWVIVARLEMNQTILDPLLLGIVCPVVGIATVHDSARIKYKLMGVMVYFYPANNKHLL
jgi:hypothetical protein